MTHIAGYPGRYNARVKILSQLKNQAFLYAVIHIFLK